MGAGVGFLVETGVDLGGGVSSVTKVGCEIDVGDGDIGTDVDSWQAIIHSDKMGMAVVASSFTQILLRYYILI